MSAPFRARRKLRFAHCDPAGIAYYPRYLELCDGVIEDWTEEVLGVSRRTLHLEMGMAIPTVSLTAEFLAVSRLGDWLDFEVAVGAVGRASADLHLDVSCDGNRRFHIGCRIVLVGGEPMKASPWPETWRAHLDSVVNEREK